MPALPILPALDGSPLGFALTLGLTAVLLAASAWLGAAPGRHAPDAEPVSVGGLAALGLAALVGAPLTTLLVILVVWAVALVASEASWIGWRRAHARRPLAR